MVNSSASNFDDINNKSKRLRFHPYYYMNRKGIYYDEEESKSFNIKINKFEKKENKLDIHFQERKKQGEKFEISESWENLKFDYYRIQGNSWTFRFTK